MKAVPGISPFSPPRPCQTSYLNFSTRLPQPNINFERPTVALAGAVPPYAELISESSAGLDCTNWLLTGTYSSIVLLVFVLPGTGFDPARVEFRKVELRVGRQMIGQLVIGAGKGIVLLERHLDREIIAQDDAGLRAAG